MNEGGNAGRVTYVAHQNELLTKKQMTKQQMDLTIKVAERYNTDKWSKTLKRHAHLAQGTAEEIIVELERLRIERRWTWGTLRTYVDAILELRGGDKGLKKWHKAIKGRATVEEQTMATPFTLQHYGSLCQLLSNGLQPDSSEWRCWVMIAVAWLYGQRPSDVAQLHRKDVTWVTLQGQRYLHCVFRRGKTVRSNGPFSLHVPRTLRVGRYRLTYLLSILKTHTKNFLFDPNDNSLLPSPGKDLLQLKPSSRQKLTKLVGSALRDIAPALQVWSVRRGGLQRLSSAGLDATTIATHFSHHANPKTLSSYLGHHRFDVTQAALHTKYTLV